MYWQTHAAHNGTVSFSGEPFKGSRRLVDTSTAPPEQQFPGDGVGLEAVTSRRNCHLLEGIKPSLGFKPTFKCHTPLFEGQDVRLAVLEKFSSKVKHVPLAGM